MRTPFTNNTIPTNRLDPAAAKIMALYPATNQPIITGGFPAERLLRRHSRRPDTDQGDLRVDHRITDKDSMFGTMSWANTDKASIRPSPARSMARTFTGAAEEDLSRNAMLSWTRVWTPAIISETRAGFTRLVTRPHQGQRQHRRVQGFRHRLDTIPAPASERRLAADSVHQQLPGQRRSRTIARSAPTTGCRPRSTATSGTSFRTCRSPRAPTR